MIHKKIYICNLELVRKYKNIPGDIVECGVWRGGMIAGIVEIFGEDRDYHLFDSFEGLPTAKEIDGVAAINWQKNAENKGYYDNCRAEIEFAKTAINKTHAKNVYYHKGWFSETLMNYKPKKGIAVLRMDGDWYESTIDILNNLFRYVNDGGIIIIDDYFTWDGCSRAVHDFLSQNKLPNRVYQFNNRIAFIIK